MNYGFGSSKQDASNKGLLMLSDVLSLIHQVKAVYLNDTPIPDMLLHLFEGERWSEKRLSQNLTTDSDGVASFLFNTSRFQADFQFTVSKMIRRDIKFKGCL